MLESTRMQNMMFDLPPKQYAQNLQLQNLGRYTGTHNVDWSFFGGQKLQLQNLGRVTGTHNVDWSLDQSGHSSSQSKHDKNVDR